MVVFSMSEDKSASDISSNVQIDAAVRGNEVTPLVAAPPAPPPLRASFAEYKRDGRNWITLVTGEYYPDILHDACILYAPVLQQFGTLLRASESSIRLLLNIAELPTPWMRVQVARVFRKYVSPETPVEMLKKKSKAKQITEEFGGTFRPIHDVQSAFETRPLPDEALCALLWEYKDRGKKGYDLTQRFFELFQRRFPTLVLTGPVSAGRDVQLATIFSDYPHRSRPVDFVVKSNSGETLAIGLARYDGDRGGAQEDDRIGGYRNCSDEILEYAGRAGLQQLKVIFMNDGPGLLLGTMWDDYARIEARHPGRVMVLTLRMVESRLTLDWLRS